MSGVVLAGAAGVGKTRLAREALIALEAQGWIARWAVATKAAQSIPFGALAHLLPAAETISGDRAEVFRGAAVRLLEAAHGDRLALGVDDAHLLDDASAALVHQLAVTAGAFVVVTVRGGMPAPDPVVAMWKDGLAERLEVQALARTEVDELLAASLGGQIDGTTLRDLWNLTRGNPMFLRELVLGGLDSGSLAQAAGVWRWDGPMTAAPRLVELVEMRLGQLAPEERDLLELLAFAEPLSPELLELMVPSSAVTSADRKGLLSVERSGRRVEVRPAHPLYGEVMRSQASPLRVRWVHRCLAEAVQSIGAGRFDDMLRILTWRLEAGVPSPSDQLIRGARQAMTLFDYSLAERLARAAVDAGAGIEAEYLVGEILLALGRVGEAELVMETLEPRGATDSDRTQIALTRAFTLYWAMNLPGQARAVLHEAQATVSEESCQDELRAFKASFEVYGGSCLDALQEVAPTLERVSVDDRAVVQALLVAVPAHFLDGDVDQAIAAANRGFGLLGRLDEEPAAPWWQLQLEVNLGNAYLAGGWLDEAEALGQQGYQRALGEPWPVEKAIWAGWHGQIARVRGRPKTALHWLREGAAAGRMDVPLPFMPTILGELAHAAALVGDIVTAEAALAEAEHYTAESARMCQLWAALARPWLAAARGELSTAVTLARDLCHHAQERGQLTFQILALHDIARLGQPRQVDAALRVAAAEAEGRLAPLYAAHATALATQDADALEKVAAGFANIGANLLAAEAAAEASRAYRAADRRSSALAAARTAATLAAVCEGAHTPALDLLRPPQSLTPREREIAGLAAQGLSSRDIAGRLFISARTVDNALQQVYGKLGLSKRSELRSALNPPESFSP
jgi:DNA-binding CsgD family transcriptional regulator